MVELQRPGTVRQQARLSDSLNDRVAAGAREPIGIERMRVLENPL